MRLFFAVLLSEEVRAAVAGAQERLRAAAGDDGIRWVAPEQFHYTLKFLGETPVEKVPSVKEVAQRVAAQHAPLSLTLAGLGAFPNLRRPQVLWVGAQEEFPVLTRLAESLEKELVGLGFPPENRHFNPHLTLARIKTPAGEKAAAQALAAQAANQKIVDEFGVIPVGNFVLMRSELRPAGPLYTVEETFALSGSEKLSGGEGSPAHPLSKS